MNNFKGMLSFQKQKSGCEEKSLEQTANIVCVKNDVTLVTPTFTQRRYSTLCSFLTKS